MALINKSEIDGKTNAAIGKVKEGVGRATGNEELEQQGAAERTAGNFEAGVGKLGRKIENVVDDVKDELKRP
jgi:uncharacterized protein YjbJ (UPF0337 family)